MVWSIPLAETMLMTKIDLDILHKTRTRLPPLRDERLGLIQKELDRISKGNRGKLR